MASFTKCLLINVWWGKSIVIYSKGAVLLLRTATKCVKGGAKWYEGTAEQGKTATKSDKSGAEYHQGTAEWHKSATKSDKSLKDKMVLLIRLN